MVFDKEETKANKIKHGDVVTTVYVDADEFREVKKILIYNDITFSKWVRNVMKLLIEENKVELSGGSYDGIAPRKTLAKTLVKDKRSRE